MMPQDANAEPLSAEEEARRTTIIAQACQAFERDCPELLAEHRGEWVAYHGDRRIALAPTRAELWQECVRRGLPDGQFWLFDIQPVEGVEVMGLGSAVIEYVDP
jgi:hypothetical protein